MGIYKSIMYYHVALNKNIEEYLVNMRKYTIYSSGLFKMAYDICQMITFLKGIFIIIALYNIIIIQNI